MRNIQAKIKGLFHFVSLGINSYPDCPERIPPFNGSPGLMVAGHVDPPLEGVAIAVELEGGSIVETLTSAEGKYRWGSWLPWQLVRVNSEVMEGVVEPIWRILGKNYVHKLTFDTYQKQCMSRNAKQNCFDLTGHRTHQERLSLL